MFSTAYHISGWLWARAQLWSLLQPCASSPTSAGSPEGTWVDARALLPTQHALARQSSTPAEGSQLFGSKTSELDALGMLLVITEKAGKTTLTRTGFETGKKMLCRALSKSYHRKQAQQQVSILARATPVKNMSAALLPTTFATQLLQRQHMCSTFTSLIQSSSSLRAIGLPRSRSQERPQTARLNI